MQNLGGGASRTQRETKLRFRFQLAFFQKAMSLFGVPVFAQNMLTTHCQSSLQLLVKSHVGKHS